ncbi:hypothetical protein EMIHUDRAFT_197126 [Emiliania huxleyi CCMP1516]|uniref:DUS-like FMN-binding domain-containing protein n=2 Tax=Emiliania huxleyi TaxID=2903 RepID=A0A0D3ITR4_EMIH1|nr:hypothetical protein EMIHUDRAFT_197126 [Emiliania huxleyi CCMP1516]EOD14649.1 hypothetical protein EMIHUDRAFT_197126 [Emiliania huxleyi CCMP1516]|eukprot:XP_005767078.1 hypothetical protein EMIHUDRAFT_197126 [Emiliania huxleyi CCMP1516]
MVRTLPVSTAAFSDGALSVAPMMDYTNRFLRYLLRRVTRRTTLYTEMVTANTLVHCDPGELPRFLEHDGDNEHPVVLQIGGSDPAMLRRASALGASWGYDAINLNCGCPSDRVAGSGCFGAALMREPSLVGDCCAAMSEGAPGVPISVKCRIGVVGSAAEAIGADEAGAAFARARESPRGVSHFAVHARQAVLGGLSPAQNRQVPPLHYGVVERLAAALPHLSFSLNGGDLDAARAILLAGADSPSDGRLSGVMVGRAVVSRPWRRRLLEEYAAWGDAIEATTPQRIRRLVLAPALNLFAGSEPRGKKFRAALDTRAKDDSLGFSSLLLGVRRWGCVPVHIPGVFLFLSVTM